jgi:hypothetical protein
MWLVLVGLSFAGDTGWLGVPETDGVVSLEQRVLALEAEVRSLREESSQPTIGGRIVVEKDTQVDEAVGLGGPVDVFGTVIGDVVALGHDIRVHPGGEVKGDAVAIGGEIEVSDGGQVWGNRVSMGQPFLGSVAGGAKGSALSFLEGIARRLALIFSFAAAGVLVVGMWPDRVQNVSNRLRERPFWQAFSGAVLTMLLIIATSLFTITVIGLPVALLLAAVLCAAWGLGLVSVCQAAGDRLPGLQGRGAWPAFLVGTTLLAIVGMFPYIGPVVLLFLSLPAAGAALTTRLGATDA